MFLCLLVLCSIFIVLCNLVIKECINRYYSINFFKRGRRVFFFWEYVNWEGSGFINFLMRRNDYIFFLGVIDRNIF